MSTHNIGVYEDLTKNIFQLSSSMHLISSSVFGYNSGLIFRILFINTCCGYF